MHIKKILWAIVALAVFPAVTMAADGTSSGQLEAVNCFGEGLYRFQSVQVSVGPEKDLYQPGEKINFSGNIINENSYPVVDGNVFVRISEINDDTENVDTVWHDVVDEFVAVSDIAINGETSKAATFSWDIPSTMATGNYRADYFFTVDKRFNLGGLPFSNEIIIGTSYFEIGGENKTSFRLDRYGTKVNGEDYQQIGTWPSVIEGEEVVFTQPIKNSTSEEISVDVKFDLYYWDSLREEDLIESKTETVKIPANGSVDLQYKISSVEESVYYLRISATDGNVSSIINLRTTSDIAKSRINYPAVNKFPILGGDEATLFSCFHMTAYKSEDGKLVLSLTDKNGDVVSEGEYSTTISGAMSAAAMTFTADNNYDYLKLNAELYDPNNKLVDSYETEYSCEAVGGEECLALAQVSGAKVINYVDIGLIIFLLSVALITVSLLKKTSENNSKRKVLLIILSLVVLSTIALAIKVLIVDNTFNVAVAENTSADGRTKTETKSGDYEFRGFEPWSYSGSKRRLLAEGTLSIGHTATLSGGQLSGGSFQIGVGESVSLSNSHSCAFNATGAGWDTPVCGTYEYFTGATGNDGRVTINDKNLSAYASSGNSNIINCSGKNCTGVSAGCTTVRLNIEGGAFSGDGCVEWEDGYACSGSTNPFIEYPSASVSSYSPTWNICVEEQIENLCGSADGTTVSEMPTGSSACISGSNQENLSDDGDTFSWDCTMDGETDSCSANQSDNGGPDNPDDPYTPITFRLPSFDIFGPNGESAPIVNEGQQCLITWTVESGIGGVCEIIDLNDEVIDSIPFDDSGSDDLEYSVNPQNEYIISCTETDLTPGDGVDPATDSSTVLECILNPNLVEQ